ncbi:two pore domain potassium channel family protein [Xylophilus sp. Kf1]|nr:two pore domain potassium channel family protein [Xylophilus sp. Kf1]
MNSFVFVLGVVVVVVTLLDAFEVVLLPRAIQRRTQVNRFFFQWTWWAWARVATRLVPSRRRDDFLAVYGPLSMVALFGLWGACLIGGFGLMQWAVMEDVPGSASLLGQIIVSGDAFFTLGYGDNVPHERLARFLVIVEAGTGFGFIALTIGYLPVLYQHFSRRDVQLIEFSLRAGSPPSAEELLDWHAHGGADALERWLGRWESWAGDLIESQAAYPMLAFYRSQHEGQSWVGSLATVLDVCSLLIAGADDGRRQQATATFVALRRTLVEVCEVLQVPAAAGARSRPMDETARTRLGVSMRGILTEWENDPAAMQAVDRLRASYEPRVIALAAYLLLPLPAWVRHDALAADRFSREAVVRRLTAGEDEVDGA